MKILIVEDDPATAKLMVNRLNDVSGIEIMVASTIKEAMDFMREIPPPQLVFLDIFLPDSHDAERTLSHIQEIKRINPKAVVLVMTGLHSDDMPEMALAAGADGFEFKHAIDTKKSFLDAIRRLVSKLPPGRERAEKLSELSERITTILGPSSEMAAAPPIPEPS